MNVRSETYFISNHDRTGFGSESSYIGLVHNCLGKSSLSTFNYLTIYRWGSHTILIPLVHRTIRTIKMTFFGHISR